MISWPDYKNLPHPKNSESRSEKKLSYEQSFVFTSVNAEVLGQKLDEVKK